MSLLEVLIYFFALYVGLPLFVGLSIPVFLHAKKHSAQLPASDRKLLKQVDRERLYGVDLIVMPTWVETKGGELREVASVIVRGLPSNVTIRSQSAPPSRPSQDWDALARSPQSLDPAFDQALSAGGCPITTRSFLDVSTRSLLVELARTHNLRLEAGTLQVDFQKRIGSSGDLWEVLQRVAQLAACFMSEPAEITNRLERMVWQEPSPAIARLALENLLAQADESRCQGVTHRILESPSSDPLLVVRAASFLAQVERLAELVVDSKVNVGVRGEALYLLYSGGDGGLPRALQLLTTLTESRSVTVVEEFARFLGRSHKGGTDAREIMAGATAEALVGLEGDTAVLLGWLNRPGLAGIAARTLAAHGEATHQAALLALAKRARSPSDREAARAAVHSIRTRLGLAEGQGALALAQSGGELSVTSSRVGDAVSDCETQPAGRSVVAEPAKSPQ